MAKSENEISLKELILLTGNWFKYLLSKWLLIGIAAAIGGGLGLLYAYTSKPTYSASVSFVLSTNSGSGGGLIGLANQFGINFSEGNDDVFAGDNIIALMKSRKMVQQALLQKPDGKESLLNMIAKEMKLGDGWQKNERTKGAYPFPDDAGKMTMVQDSLFREIYFTVQKNMLDVSKPDKKQSIYAVTTKTTKEAFSYYLTKYLVDVTSRFYIDTKTKTAKENLTMVKNEADSLRNMLGGAITLSASQTDLTFNLNPAYQVQRSGAAQSQVRASALGTAYGEVLKNLEIAKITLQKETPLYQVIDEPTLPLLRERPGRLKSLIVGGFIGGLLICFFLIMRRIFNTIFK